MKKLLLVACLVASLSLAGCAEIASGINQVSAALGSPAASQAAANIEKFSKAFACFVSDLSAVSTQVSKLVNTDQATIDVNGQIYTVSALICTRLGGTPSEAPVQVVK